MRERNALLSVYNKDGIVDFAKELEALGFRVWASGGTARFLEQGQVNVYDVAELVGAPLLGHRVVTLSREVHAGLLARDTPDDHEELRQFGARFFDLVCVDFYPLSLQLAKSELTREKVIELTDIGGPTMITAGAKGKRIVICDPADRVQFVDLLKAGRLDEDFIEGLAIKGLETVGRYYTDAAILRKIVLERAIAQRE